MVRTHSRTIKKIIIRIKSLVNKDFIYNINCRGGGEIDEIK